MELRCRKCRQEYLASREKWDAGHIFKCIECGGEEFDMVKEVLGMDIVSDPKFEPIMKTYQVYLATPKEICKITNVG